MLETPNGSMPCLFFALFARDFHFSACSKHCRIFQTNSINQLSQRHTAAQDAQKMKTRTSISKKKDKCQFVQLDKSGKFCEPFSHKFGGSSSTKKMGLKCSKIEIRSKTPIQSTSTFPFETPSGSSALQKRQRSDSNSPARQEKIQRAESNSSARQQEQQNSESNSESNSLSSDPSTSSSMPESEQQQEQLKDRKVERPKDPPPPPPRRRANLHASRNRRWMSYGRGLLRLSLSLLHGVAGLYTLYGLAERLFGADVFGLGFPTEEFLIRRI